MIKMEEPTQQIRVRVHQDSLVDCIPSLLAPLGRGGGLVGFLSAADQLAAAFWVLMAPCSSISMVTCSGFTSPACVTALGGGFFGGWRLFPLFLLILELLSKPAGFHSSPFIAA